MWFIIVRCARHVASSAGKIYYLTNEYFNVPMLVEKLRQELINRGKVPAPVRDYLKSIDLFGNPYQKPAAKRTMGGRVRDSFLCWPGVSFLCR